MYRFKSSFAISIISMLLLLSVVLVPHRSVASPADDSLVGTEFFFATTSSFNTDLPNGEPAKLIFIGQNEPGSGGTLCGLVENAFASRVVVTPGNVPANQGQRAPYVDILGAKMYPSGTEARLEHGLYGTCGSLNIYKATIIHVPVPSPS